MNWKNCLRNLLMNLTPFRGLIIIVICWGIFFRFTHLDTQIYWHDEVFTAIRVSGYTATEIHEKIYQGQLLTLEDLHTYQQPNLDKNLGDVIQGLAIEDPQHPPLYFLISRGWQQLFGSSIIVKRTLPALLSLLIFPSVYWLCLELFSSSLTGWVAMAMIAVSPFHVLFAQEDRQYSLWGVIVVLSSAALLWAMRRNSKMSWGVYALTLSLGFYTFLFTLLVAVSHGIYVMIQERFRLSGRGIAYGISSILAGMSFLPWIMVVMAGLSTIQGSTSWMTQTPGTPANPSNFIILIDKFIYGINLIFVDPSLNYRFKKLIIVCLLTAGISLLYKNHRHPAFFHLITFITFPFLALIIPDLILGGNRSTVYRYLIPIYLGIQVTIASLLTDWIHHPRLKNWQQNLGRFVLVMILSMGIVSCVINSQNQVPWSKDRAQNKYDPQIAQIINNSPAALVISDGGLGDILSLSYLLNPQVKYQLITPAQVDQLEHLDSFSAIFLLDPSPELQSQLDLVSGVPEFVPVEQVPVPRLWQFLSSSPAPGAFIGSI